LALKRLAFILLPIALAGCSVGTVKLPTMAPMALGPSDTANTACLTYDGAPTYGDCQGGNAVSISPERTPQPQP
jgi:hypothetical protein